MKMNYIVKLFFVLMIGFLAYSCGDDDEVVVDACDGVNATYNGDVKPIILNSCAYLGCHDGSNGNISEDSRDYTTFEGMATATASGSFENRVLVQRNMPDPDDVPADRPGELTTAELQVMQCWVDAGFPEG